MGVKKSAVCKSRPPPNGMNPASSRVSIPLTKPLDDPGASPLSACSRSPGANFEAQPAWVEYFVSLMRVRSSIGQSILRHCTRSEPKAEPSRSLTLSFPRKRESTCLLLLLWPQPQRYVPRLHRLLHHRDQFGVERVQIRREGQEEEDRQYFSQDLRPAGREAVFAPESSAHPDRFSAPSVTTPLYMTFVPQAL